MNYLRYPRGLYIAFYAWAKYIQSLRLWRLKHRAWGPFVEHEVIRGIIARNMKSSEVLSRSRDPAMHVISAHISYYYYYISMFNVAVRPICRLWRLMLHVSPIYIACQKLASFCLIKSCCKLASKNIPYWKVNLSVSSMYLIVCCISFGSPSSFSILIPSIPTFLRSRSLCLSNFSHRSR